MTIKDFQKFLKINYKRILLVSFLFSLLISFVSSYFPKSYVTEGTFILIPNFQNSKNESPKNIYNFDGYYLDQISQSYSKTILGLIETPEFKKKVSQELKLENNSKNFFLLNLNTNFKEIAPRVLVLNVKSDTKEDSTNMFVFYEKHILLFSEKYNSEKVFRLERLDTEINTFENTPSTLIYFISSFFLAIFSTVSVLYLKDSRK